ncbi:N-acetyl-D-glucosamine kinase, partial [Haemophilus influenzae]
DSGGVRGAAALFLTK